MATLENWSCVHSGDLYLPPEVLSVFLRGKIYGHPNQERFPDGKGICTSAIKDIDGRMVLTNSGSTYILGKVDPEYKKWTEETLGKIWDDENPIKIHKLP
jgi:hypothetical protein